MRTTRRSFVRASLAGGALTAIASPAIIRSTRAAAAVRFVNVFTLSGPFSSAGASGPIGANLAITAGARDFGISVDSRSIDDEGNPGRVVPKIITALEQDGIRFFTGAVLSSVALAISPQVAKGGGVFTTGVGADELTGSACRRATFRWAVPTYGAIQQTVRPLIETFPQAKRWYTITPKYIFGEALLKNAQNVFKEKGVEHVGNSYHSLTETEFSGYITDAAAARPDVLLLLNFGQQSTNALRQAVDFGLKAKMKILMAWDAGLEQYREIGSDILEGVYFGSQYWHEIDCPGNKRFVALMKEDSGKLPTYSMANPFACNELLIRGIKAAGSAEPPAVIKALEGMEYEGLTGDESVRPFDHQCVKNYYLLRGKAKDAKAYDDQYVEVISFGKSFETQAQSLCKLD